MSNPVFTLLPYPQPNWWLDQAYALHQASMAVLPQHTALWDPQAFSVPHYARDSVPPADMDAQPPSQENSLPTLGPPPKPRCCGHAIWVGNLPPGAKISGLKDFFSQEHNGSIESVKLMSRTNCAFINYSSLEACRSASKKFNGSDYGGNILICRLRIRDVQPNSNAWKPNGAPSSQSSDCSTPRRSGSPLSPVPVFSNNSPTGKVPARFFIMKSLTMQDIYSSVKQGVWATQTHNFEALSDAFKNADTVYLFFSVNRSGQYCGYARMTSEIHSPTELLQSLESGSSSTPSSSPRQTHRRRKSSYSDPSSNLRVTVTPATADAPRGRIVEDLAHDVIFWEAEEDAAMRIQNPQDNDPDGGSQSPSLVIVNSPARPSLRKIDTSGASETGQDSDEPPDASFKLQWISLQPLPFYMTRGLRNAMNKDRDVKVARDGTEVDPATGVRLVQLFQEPR